MTKGYIFQGPWGMVSFPTLKKAREYAYMDLLNGRSSVTIYEGRPLKTKAYGRGKKIGAMKWNKMEVLWIPANKKNIRKVNSKGQLYK